MPCKRDLNSCTLCYFQVKFPLLWTLGLSWLIQAHSKVKTTWNSHKLLFVLISQLLWQRQKISLLSLVFIIEMKVVYYCFCMFILLVSVDYLMTLLTRILFALIDSGTWGKGGWGGEEGRWRDKDHVRPTPLHRHGVCWLIRGNTILLE